MSECTECSKKSIFKKIGNIVRGTTNFVFPTEESEALAEPRLKVCYGCENCRELVKINGIPVHQCLICKCPVESKTTVQDEKCPIDKWE